MVWDRTLRGALLLALGMLSMTAGADAQEARKRPATDRASLATDNANLGPMLDPKAIDLLKAMSARLAAAKSMAFTATITYESPSRLGPPLAYTTRSDVVLQRPNKLRVVTPGDGPATEFYLDGESMSA